MAERVTLARPYARAAFEVALAAGELDKWQQMLSLAGSVVAQEKMRNALANPANTAEQNARLLSGVLAGEVDAPVQNLIQTLAVNKRLTLLADIAAQFAALKAEHQKTLAVEVVSAFPLDDAAKQRLQAALTAKLARAVNLSTSVDKTLLGGVLIKAGDTVIDHSVRGRLQKLAEALVA